MKHLWKAAVLFVGLSAVFYGTKDVWPQAGFANDVAKIQKQTVDEQGKKR